MNKQVKLHLRFVKIWKMFSLKDFKAWLKQTKTMLQVQSLGAQCLLDSTHAFLNMYVICKQLWVTICTDEKPNRNFLFSF